MGCIKYNGIGCFVCCFRKTHQVINNSFYCILISKLRSFEQGVNVIYQNSTKNAQ